MEDIVERLREYHCTPECNLVCDEAADEIERLRAWLDGDPDGTASPELRKEWRLAAVRWADRLEHVFVKAGLGHEVLDRCGCADCELVRRTMVELGALGERE